MRLAATALEEFWGDGPLLSLGPWVTPYARRSSWDSRDIVRARDPFADDGAVHAARLRAQAAFGELIGPLGAELGRVHGLKRSERHWTILLGPWLLRFLMIALDRKARLDAAFADHPGLDALFLAEEDFRAPRDTRDFQELGFGDAYNQQLVTEIMTLSGRSFPARRLAGAAPGVFSEGKLSWPRRLADRAVRAWGPALVLTEAMASRGDQWRLIAALDGEAGLFLGRLPPGPPPDPAARARLGVLSPKGEDARLAAALLNRHLPTIFLEGFAAARAAALAGWRRRPRAMLSTTGWIWNEALKFAAAEFAEEGTRLCGAQHGAGYGVVEDIPTEWMERATTDVFVTWGWDDGDRPVRSLPNPEAVRQRAAGGAPGARGGDRVLFVTENYPPYPYQLYSYPIAREIEEGYERQAAFITALSGPAREALLVRLYPIENGWSAEQRLRARFPDAELQRGGPLTALFPRARLLIFNQAGTAFLESLAYGAPSLIFLPRRLERVRPAAEAGFRALREAGIVVDSPEAAARRAVELYADPLAWWDAPKTRAARELWETRYAGLAPDWLGPWRDFARELASP